MGGLPLKFCASKSWSSGYINQKVQSKERTEKHNTHLLLKHVITNMKRHFILSKLNAYSVSLIVYSCLDTTFYQENIYFVGISKAISNIADIKKERNKQNIITA